MGLYEQTLAKSTHFQKNAFENRIFEMAIILSRPQCVSNDVPVDVLVLATCNIDSYWDFCKLSIDQLRVLYIYGTFQRSRSELGTRTDCQ